MAQLSLYYLKILKLKYMKKIAKATNRNLLKFQPKCSAQLSKSILFLNLN